MAQISIIGKGATLVYIDGQQVTSTQLLQSLSSQDLKSIEIMENPSAQYAAAGNAVINIVTKSNNLEGYKIGLTQEFEQGRFFRSYYKANAYYRLSKLSLQTSYGFRPYKRRGREYYFRSIQDDLSLIEIDNKLIYSRQNTAHDISFRANYQFSIQQRVGIQCFGMMSDGEQQSENRNLFSTNQSLDFKLNTDIRAPFDRKNNTLSAFYEYQLDSLGSQLRLSGQYANFKNQRMEHIQQILNRASSMETQNRQSQNDSKITVQSVQLDYRHFFNASSQLNVGLKHASIKNKSQLDFENEAVDGTFKLDPLFSNQYDYKEKVSAAYGEWKWTNTSVHTVVGLRIEWTQAEGLEGVTVDKQLFEKEYINVFPSASITKTIDDQNKVNLSYNYRIQRPRFQDLNPFVWYADSLVSLQGNANLRPEFSHLIDAAWTHKGWNLKVNYTNTKDKINTIIRIKDLDDPSVFAFVRDNIESVNNFALSLSRSMQIGAYSAYYVIGARMETHQYNDLGTIVSNQKPGFYLYTNQSLKLPGQLLLEAIYSYTSPRVDGIYTDNPISYLNVAISRKFWNSQLNVRLLANDIFDKYKFTGISTVNNNDWTYLSEGDWHFIKLSLNWNFGKMNTNNLRERKISKSEIGRAASM